MDKKAVQKIRDDIVLAALPIAADEGWGGDVLEQAAGQSGYEATMVRAVFPESVAEALDHFADMADRAMFKALMGVNPQDLKVRERVRDALVARYRYLTPHKRAVQKSLSFWVLPLRKIRAGRIVWRTADRIWEWAGDESQDYNFYTKRGLLSGVIASTTLAWVNFDEDEDLHQTQCFIERRIENVLQIGKVAGKFKKKGEGHA